MTRAVNVASSTNLALVTPTITGATITVASTAAPAFNVYNTGGQTLTHNVATKLTLNTKEYDTNTNFDTTTNYRFTPTVAGYYFISAFWALSGTMTGFCATYIYKNGSVYKSLGTTNVSANYTAGFGSSLVYLNGSTDYIEIYATQGSGISQTVVAGNQYAWATGFLARSA